MGPGDTLKRYFLEELKSLRVGGSEFAQDHPVAAGALRLGAEPSRDPHVEMMLQSFAYLTGQLRYTMDRQDAELPGQLLQALNPALACPVPSMAVAQLSVHGDNGNFAKRNVLPRGSALSALGTWRGSRERCQFTTLEETELWPLEVVEVAPLALNRLPQGSAPAGCRGALGVRVRANGVGLFEMPLTALNFCLVGDRRFALYDLLSQDVLGVAWGRGDSDEAKLDGLRRLPDNCLRTGLTGRPLADGSGDAGHPGLALLRTYFASAERFLFASLDGIDTAGLTDELQLVFFLAQECPAVQTGDMRLGCVPVVNLYRRRVEPFALRAGCVRYPLQGDRLRHSTCEVHSVAELSLTRADGTETPLAPLYGDSTTAEVFWSLQREVSQLPSVPGTELQVDFVNRDFVPALPDGCSVGGSLWCTNRRLAESLEVGATLELSKAGCAHGAVLVTAPSAHQTPALYGQDAQRLCAQLSDFCLPLSGGSASLAQLKAVLTQHCPGNDARGRQQIEGLRGIAHERVAERTGQEAWHGLSTGIDLTLTVDLAQYAESSALLLGEVLSECFAGFVPLNSFVRLHMRDVGGAHLKSWPLRTRAEWT